MKAAAPAGVRASAKNARITPREKPGGVLIQKVLRMPRNPSPASDPASASAPDPGSDADVNEYTGLHAWAQSTGVDLPDDEPEPVDPADAAARIERLWANAASPEDFPALREHRVEQDGVAAVIPEDLRAAARAAADDLRHGGRKPNRGRGRGRGKGPADRQGPAADPMEAALDTIESLLDALGIPEDACEFGENTLAFRVDDEALAGYPPMPSGYGFKGGVARKALARALRLPISTSAVRDIDLLRLNGTSPEHGQELAEVYMTDDVIHGDAEVEEIIGPLDYLTTREFTVNEILFVDGMVRITPLGLLDTLGGVVRVTQAHLNKNRGRVHPVVGFKALRFAGTGRHEGNDIRIAQFRLSYRPRAHPLAFFFALQLSRAFEADPAIAELYMGMARRRGFLEHVGLHEDASAQEAAGLLKERLPGYYLEFPGVDNAEDQGREERVERGKMPVEKGKRKKKAGQGRAT